MMNSPHSSPLFRFHVLSMQGKNKKKKNNNNKNKQTNKQTNKKTE